MDIEREQQDFKEELIYSERRYQREKALRDTIKILSDALTEAKQTIRALHGPVAWDIYERCSPEMKKLNAAIERAKL